MTTRAQQIKNCCPTIIKIIKVKHRVTYLSRSSLRRLQIDTPKIRPKPTTKWDSLQRIWVVNLQAIQIQIKQQVRMIWIIKRQLRILNNINYRRQRVENLVVHLCDAARPKVEKNSRLGEGSLLGQTNGGDKVRIRVVGVVSLVANTVGT